MRIRVSRWQAPLISAVLSFVGAVLGGLVALVFMFASGSKAIFVSNLPKRPL